jgi:colanic acid biosynthesis glycosyl transferase WcaI
MRVTLINQAFFPDVVSSGQHLTDLALALAAGGHHVTVLASRRAYDDPKKHFLGRETWKGIRVIRVASPGFGKSARWRRALDFACFLGACALRLSLLPRQDVIVAMTSPPLVSVLAAAFATLHRSRFVYWVMDLNPDEALAAGWLKQGALVTRSLEALSCWSLRQAETVIVLDRFMKERILEKKIARERVEIIPPWPHDSEVHFDPNGRSQFRREHGLENKFVVMYSGNHSPCHPLDTLLAAAKRLAKQADIVFCFIGGGSEFSRVKKIGRQEGLQNIIAVPYEPLHRLAGSLSAADLHLVVMGKPFVGLVHPCKIYNILRIGAPLLYIGPTPSHVSELLEGSPNSPPAALLRHGQVAETVHSILGMKDRLFASPQERISGNTNLMSQQLLVRQLASVIERAATAPARSRGARKFRLAACEAWEEKIPLKPPHLTSKTTHGNA